MKRLLIIGSSLLFVYILGAVFLYTLQEKFIFLDGELPEDHVYSFDTPHEEVDLTTDDGAKLNALHFKAEDTKGLILYFHGNRGNLTRWGKVVERFVKLDYDVLVMDYRGYGKSRGERSMELLLSDAELFYSYALSQYPENEITLYGRSLGTGIASWLAGKHVPKRLILETPYYSLAAVAQRYYPIYPSNWALRYNFQSFKYLKTAECLVHIFHGTDDEVVPYKSGEKLHESLPEGQSEFITIEEGRHKNLSDFEEFRNQLSRILK
ncbi:alpha/beta hydrolase [Roseivirga sp. E12]|uniref:alpha/beta hydrolase n=1 Tax=Roseivirga sp. E12 TaxID=2819237 RepID=UPI001ABCE7E9|nr:alpha/beta fold hydrolase [Roseivirga sp. E12]MBO3698639.1 alpha/beta fold hydrolase [Roseivirga sp. E12]